MTEALMPRKVDMKKQRKDMYVGAMLAIADTLAKDEIHYEPFEPDEIDYIVRRIYYRMQLENGNIDEADMKRISEDIDNSISVRVV